MIRSLRLRLLLGTSLATAIILGLLGAAIYLSVRRSLIAEFDGSTRTQAMALSSMTEQKNGKVKLEFDGQQMPEFASQRHAGYFEIWLDDGSVLARSPSLAGKDLPKPAAAANAQFQPAILPDGRQGRALTLTFTPSMDSKKGVAGSAPPRHAILLVSRDTHVIDHSLEGLGWLLTGLCTAAIAVSGAVLFLVVGRGVAPVRRLARDIEALDESNLAHRFDPRRFPPELQSIADRINGLLQRLQDAFARQRSFTADVAHELRTPLAGLRTTLEVCRSRQRSAGEYEQSLDRCTRMIDRMQEMVERLLLLARAEAGQLVVRREPIDLCPLIEACWTEQQSHARQRGLQDQWDLPQRCDVLGDGELLRIVLNNLLDNAVSYADEGGSVRTVVTARGEFTEVSVANTGSEIDPADAEHVFDRFWRGDAARADNGVHCGLGLSLCQRLTTLLGGKIEIETHRGGLFTARLRIPAVSQTAGAEPAIEPANELG